MSSQVFRDMGFLQELNRNFLHPLGLALALVPGKDQPDGSFLVQIWDERGDPEGWFFSPDELEGDEALQKMENVAELREGKAATRIAVEGSVVQSLPARWK